MNKSPLAVLTFILCLACFSAANGQEEATPAKTPAPPETSKPAPKFEAQLQLSTESLSRGFGQWRSAALYAQRKFANRRIVWGMYRVSERSRTRDTELIGGIYQPLSRTLAITAEGMYSPTRRFVGRVSAMAEVEKQVRHGLVVHAGTRFTKYDGVTASTGYGLVEKYWGQNRGAYTLYVTRLSNAGVAPSHRVQYNRYYGERNNTVGVAMSFGREHENLGPQRGILRSQTWGVSLSARHWFSDNFGISLDGTYHRQGNIYTRRGVTLGIRYRF